MKNIKLFTTIFLLFIQYFNSQNIKFISEKTALPLTKVSVFDKEGNIIAVSDINGLIEQASLKKDAEDFQLVYDNMIIAKLSFNEINKAVIKLNDRIKDIEPVVIRNSKPAKYTFVKGNFNAYVTVNNMLNCYVDGIATYVFDNKKNKVKDIHVEEYRIFWLENAKNEKKKQIPGISRLH